MASVQEDTYGQVYSPWKKHTTILAIKPKDWPRILITVCVCLALFFFLGTFKQSVSRPLSAAENLTVVSELEQMRDALITYEKLAAASGTDDMAKLDMSAEEKELVNKARLSGIHATSTREQLSALAPQTKQVDVEVFEPIPRFILVLALPSVLVFIWNAELGHGWSLRSETKRLSAYFKRQKFYVSQKKSYLEER